MPELLALVTQILDRVLIALGILESLQGENPRIAREGTPYNIEALAQDTLIAVNDADHGLSALSDQIAAVRHDTSADPRPDLDVIFETLLALTPVTLPEEPPPGYGFTGELGEVWLSNLEVYDWCPVD